MSAGAGGGDGGFEGVKKEKRLAMDEVAMAQIWGLEFLDRGLLVFCRWQKNGYRSINDAIFLVLRV